MKKAILAIAAVVLLGNLTTKATHIVGGEFSVQWKSGNTYHVKFNFYRDCSSVVSFDSPDVYIGIYDLVTNAPVKKDTIPFIYNATSVLQLGDSCYKPTGLCVQLGYYEKDITIPNNPNGYYISYNRCCRNQIITNLSNPGAQGETWYMEIPDPALHNSSPVIAKYPRAYFCSSYPNIDSLTATDADGDSLVYSLITPFDTHNQTNNPYPDPGPYPNVTWQVPYSALNMIGGTPPMAINRQTGVLTANPPNIGVFVFGVRIEEWREGPNPKKLGEIRRDIQYSVQNCTPPPPVFKNGSQPLQHAYTTQAGDTFNLQIVVTDSKPADLLTLTAESDLFTDGSNVSFAQPVVGHSSVQSDFNYYTTCSDTGVHRLTVVLLQNSCFKTDTIRFDVDITVLPPDIPYFSTPITFIIHRPNAADSTVTIASGDSITLNMGETIEGIVVANDVDPADVITLSGQSELLNGGFIAGFNTVNGLSVVQSEFTYSSACKDARTGSYRVKLTASHCYQNSSFSFDVIVKTPDLDPIPNVFTPNGDKVNDYFQIKTPVVNFNCDFSIKIFNRWGITVFESTDANFKWNGNTKGGSLAPEGVYYYIIEGMVGTSEFKRKGTVNLKL